MDPLFDSSLYTSSDNALDSGTDSLISKLPTIQIRVLTYDGVKTLLKHIPNFAFQVTRHYTTAPSLGV